jgi:hypothetical protein
VSCVSVSVLVSVLVRIGFLAACYQVA